MRSVLSLFTATLALLAACTSRPCLDGSTHCGTVCVDVQTDQANCGACGQVCAANQTCEAGACVEVPPCLGGSSQCDATCVDLQTDQANCGACDNACSGDEQCVGGACQKVTCGALGATDCGGTCTNLASDQLHCGACDHACAENEQCVAGSCSAMGLTTCHGSACGSCAAIAAADPGATSGPYAIDPDGTGGAAPFAVFCEMAVQGGGWTQVTEPLAASLTTNVNRQYLYLYGAAGYVSPCTKQAWSWADASGQQLTGTYAYFTGTSAGTFDCSGSGEQPAWGVGCSDGPGHTSKVLPDVSRDATAATSGVCQDSPGAFGGAACQGAVMIFEREGCAL
jgi:hypothetical protein